LINLNPNFIQCMKNLNILKWLVSLDLQKFVLAVFLIIMSSLYIDLKTSRIRNENILDETYKARIKDKTDCDSIINLIRIEYNQKSEDYLKEQILKLQQSKDQVEQLIKKNNQILKNRK